MAFVSFFLIREPGLAGLIERVLHISCDFFFLFNFRQMVKRGVLKLQSSYPIQSLFGFSFASLK